jgi:nicotinamidase-related amidase
MDSGVVQLDPKKTALVSIDLQRGILERDWQPYQADEVLERSMTLMEEFHRVGALVVLVHVEWDRDFSNAPHGITDSTGTHPRDGYPSEWSELDPRLPRSTRDLVVRKRQWGAFEGTELESTLRRRGIDTIVLVGIATNMGIESTARQAFEKNFNVLLIEDAMASFSTEAHEFSIGSIFPRLGRVRRAQQLEWKTS